MSAPKRQTLLSKIAGTRKKSVAKFDLNQSQMIDLKIAFDLFDNKNSGFIEEKDLKVAIRALGFEPKKEEIRIMMDEINRDGSDRISFNDFLHLMTLKMAEKDTKQEILKSFRLFDDDEKGAITYRNLKRVAHQLGEVKNEEELREMIVDADFNCDGVVDVEEFLKIIRRSSLI